MAIDNCKQVLTQLPKEYGEHTLKRYEKSQVYWFNMKQMCFGFTKYAKVTLKQCHDVKLPELPEVQLHLVPASGGYAIGKDEDSENKKLILTCAAGIIPNAPIVH